MKTSKFQMILLGIFAFFIAGGLLFFAAFKGKQSSEGPAITIWGTLDSGAMNIYLEKTVAKVESTVFSQVNYVQKRPETMYTQYTEALIAGTAPDILLMPQEDLLKYRGKIVTIPYANYPERDYKSTFIQEAELYLTNEGITAIPFTIDPLVMYWNRDIFSNALIATPPKTWEELLALVPTLTKRDSTTVINRSAVGLGEYENVDHAKEIVSMLLLQAGNPITYRYGNGYKSSLSVEGTGATSPGEQALLFFTQFADPSKQVYSWSRSLPTTKSYFAANKLGIYFGLASEYREIYELNPNLNFDVAVVPQIKMNATSNLVNTTYGKMYGLSLSISGKNTGSALAVMNYLISSATLPVWVETSGLPSVRRDSLGLGTTGSSASVFAVSSLWSRAWIDPDAARTSTIFKNIIESVTSGRATSGEAINNGHSQLQYLLDRI